MEDNQSINIANMNSNFDDQNNLPDEFKELGWRKCYSKREKRYYYFNKNTQESVWDLRDLYLLHTKRDPLGICTPSPSVVTSPIRFHSDNMTPHSEFSSIASRRLSDDYDYLNKNSLKSPSAWSSVSTSSDSKRIAKLRLNCNLRTDTNAIINERPMSLLLPPHPNIEIIRNEAFNTLKEFFELQITRLLNGIQINNLFFECLLHHTISDKSKRSVDKLDDELLPKLDEKIVIENFLEPKIKEIFSWNNEIKSFSDLYGEAKNFKILVDNIFSSTDERDENDEITIKLNEIFEKDVLAWLKWTKSTNKQDNLNDYLKSLKKKCENFLVKALELQLNTFFNEYTKLHTHITQDLYANYEKIYEKNKIQIIKSSPKYQSDRKVLCYPILICTPSPLLPVPELYHDLEKGYSYLKLNEEKLSIRTDYFTKLEYLYKYNCKDDKGLLLFLARVWTLLKRYELFDSTMHLNLYSLNLNVYDCLESYFNVTFELFSNPFNCYFKQYCSLFDDTDGYFGSRGSFKNLEAQSGSFLACLPNHLTIVDNYFQHMKILLNKSQEALSFIVFVPINVNLKKLIEKMKSNEFCKKSFVLEENSVELNRFNDYKTLKESKQKLTNEYEIACLIIQNKQAEFKFPIDEQRIDQLKFELKINNISNQLNYSP